MLTFANNKKYVCLKGYIKDQNSSTQKLRTTCNFYHIHQISRWKMIHCLPLKILTFPATSLFYRTHILDQIPFSSSCFQVIYLSSPFPLRRLKYENTLCVLYFFYINCYVLFFSDLSLFIYLHFKSLKYQQKLNFGPYVIWLDKFNI